MLRYTMAAGALTVALVPGSGFAQENPPPVNRGAMGAERSGTATPRGDSGSAAPRGGGEIGSSGVGGGMSGGVSAGSSSSPSAPPSSSSFVEPPQRSQERAPVRRGSGERGSGEATGRSAVPRGGSATGSSGDRGGSRPAGVSPGATASGDRTGAPARRAVPAYSRPRDGRTVTGEAAERRNAPAGNPNIFFYPRPYYSPYGFWGPGFGYGLGLLYYDPFNYGGYGYGGYPYYGGGYYGGGYYGGGGGYYGGSGGYDQSYGESGSVRLKIKPTDAQVYVDGYFVGVVDSFDGVFQKLTLEAGPHRVEIKADGFEPVSFDILVTPGETLTYKGDLKPIR